MAENDREHQEWLLIYQMSVQEIAFFKGQQWLVTNYGLLLYAALVGVASLLGSSLTVVDRWVLTALVWAIFGSALCVVRSLDTALMEARDRLKNALNHFTKEVSTALEPRTQAGRTHLENVSRLLTNVSRLLQAVLLVAAGVTSWLLVWRLHAS